MGSGLGWLGPALALALLPAMAGPARGTAPDSPPVLLRESLLLTPPEAAGLGLAPEVKVRVTVDPRGRVSAVEVLHIEPASELNDLFRRVVAETLEHWRYAPARAGGEPVAATLEWSIQFKAQEGVERDGAEYRPHWFGLGDDADARRARVYTLPLAQREELLQRYARMAGKHLDPARRRRFDSAHFVVLSDAAEARTAEIIAGNLEATFTVLDAFFKPQIEPQPEPFKILVFVYQQRGALEALRAEASYHPGSYGLFLAPGLLAIHLEVPDPDYALSVLIHEACHLYSDRRLRRPGFVLPRWMEEGFAEYIGNSRIKKGQLIPGSTLTGRYVLGSHSGAYRRTLRAGWSVQEIQRAIRKGEAPSLSDLIALDASTFYSAAWPLNYATSWIFVHFLRHGEPGWAEAEFPALMLYLGEGYPAREALEVVYGRPLKELEEPFRKYAKGF